MFKAINDKLELRSIKTNLRKVEIAWVKQSRYRSGVAQRDPGS
jgi:hypothetical protein